jgi:mannose-6-phosphate isomerase-like protein (cupin superfamily)
MIVRNLREKAVMETTYLAHGGAIAQMILDQRILKEIGFLAVDPMEEIYFVLSGVGEMGVDDESHQVGPGDATWIPTGSSHRLLNNGNEDLVILVVASSNW